GLNPDLFHITIAMKNLAVRAPGVASSCEDCQKYHRYRTFRLLLEQVNILMRFALLVASMLCGLPPAPAHAAQTIRLAQAAPAQPASPAPAPADLSATPPQTSQPAPVDQPAADASQSDEPAGNVAILKGTATVTRNGMTGPLKLQDDIFKG
ncbi:hypothetical protein KSU18_22385, partial [Enterobacter quasiroggenkampii]|nr:hypothetical protein [Enterobacter quasiroggenkampii]